ncbi:MAG: DUF2975 domain-containing protein [Alphaproteobacteria bacterium]|nr:DUF2975 domain-containing protein [Alphaproteobacteria bacterium]
MGMQKVTSLAATMVGRVAFAIPLLLAAIVLPLIGRVYLAIFEPAVPDPQAIWTNVAVHVVEALPSLILSWTMYGVLRVLVEYGQGRYLSLRASRSLKWVGLGALVALLLNVMVVPITVAALRGSSLWIALNPHVFDLCIMMFAAGMLTIGSLLEAAARDLQSEHDQIV